MSALKSIKPLFMSSKFIKKLKEEIASRNACPVQLEKKSNTIGNPLTVNKKHTVTERINAITWFFVSAERQDPIDKYPPAIKKLPM